MKLHRHTRQTLIAIAIVALIPLCAMADHKDDHDTPPGDPNEDPYGCIIENEDGEAEELNKLDCILHKLDRIERRMGCPLEDYLDGSCPYSPADTTATFCISQGRAGSLNAEFAAEAHAEYDLGAGWPNVAWAKAIGKIEHPVVLPPFLPIPTQLKVAGEASLGRNFDLCIEVPLVAAEDPGPLEVHSDAELIDGIVRTINEPRIGDKSKFQRRLGRLTNYATLRVPGSQRPNSASAAADQTQLAVLLNDDGESEFDFADDAVQKLMDGDFQLPLEGGPLGILKSGLIQDLALALEIPEPARAVLSDPDIVIGQIFELGMLPVGGSALGVTTSFGPAVCDRFGFNDELRARFPAIETFCGLFSALPTFGQTTGIFGVVSAIRSIVGGLPTLDQIKAAACEIAGWNCPEDN
jgi:hypothetical protein